MTKRLKAAALCCAIAPLWLMAGQAQAAPKPAGGHRFAVLGHHFVNGGTEARLELDLANSGSATLAFVVATGIKANTEPCTDALYAQRHEVFNQARRPMIVVPAASDWADCKNAAGRQFALERLNRLRELFYPEPVSLGKKTLPVARLSASFQYRSYAENAYWEVGNVLYATLNIPANNNNYRPEAGRNSEFEDRVVANRFWLNRLFSLARRKKLDAVVLFSEGDMKALSEKSGLLAMLGRGENRQDGFAPPRRLVNTLAEKFAGKVLLIDAAPGPEAGEAQLEWRGNLGHVSVGQGAYEIQVKPGAEPMFSFEKP